MRQSPDSSNRVDSVLLLLFAFFLFLSPFTVWWSSHTRLWYLPYLLWLGLIALIAVLSSRRVDEL
jgi:hypothetical protein